MSAAARNASPGGDAQASARRDHCADFMHSAPYPPLSPHASHPPHTIEGEDDFGSIAGRRLTSRGGEARKWRWPWRSQR